MRWEETSNHLCAAVYTISSSYKNIVQREAALAKKEEGNIYFKQNNFKQAIKEYGVGLEWLHSKDSADSSEESCEHILLSNRSSCHSALGAIWWKLSSPCQ